MNNKQIAARLVYRAKSRAQRKAVPFNLTAADVVIPECCPIFGTLLKPGTMTSDAPSLDRFVPERGYVRGNVHVISKRANTMKNTNTLEALRWARGVADKSGEPLNDETQAVLDWMELIELLGTLL